MIFSKLLILSVNESWEAELHIIILLSSRVPFPDSDVVPNLA